MNKCNLLPWRETLFMQQKKIFIYGFNFAVLMPFLLLFITHKIIIHRSESVLKNNEILNGKMQELTRQLQDYKMLEQHHRQLMEIKINLRTVQKQQQQMVQLLTNFGKIMSPQIYFTTIIFEKNEFMVKGKSTVPTEITRFIRQLEQLPEVATVKLNNLHDHAEQITQTNFHLTISLKK